MAQAPSKAKLFHLLSLRLLPHPLAFRRWWTDGGWRSGLGKASGLLLTAPSLRTAAQATVAARRRTKKAKADLGNAQTNKPPSRRHRPLTARALSDMGACCPEASQQACPPSKQCKKRPGRAPGRLPPPPANFAPSPLLPPALPSPTFTLPSLAASRLFSHGYAPMLATLAPTRRTSNPND